MSRRSDEEWEQLFREQALSGKTQGAFCRERGISKASFVCRKSKLKREAASGSFVELNSASCSSTSKVELELPGGAVLRMSW